MANFAQVNADYIVVNVVVLDDSLESTGVDYLTENFPHDGIWVQTSRNTYGGVHLNGGTPLRKNYAYIGATYDLERDAFYGPQPFPSWTLDEETCYWIPPSPRPETTETSDWRWNESTLSWDEVTE